MGSNPVILPLILALASAFNSAFKWSHISHSVPVLWNVDASPLLWWPRWLAVPLLPVLQFLISYIIYLVVARDSFVDKQAGESKHSVAQIIVLPALFFFCIDNFVLLEFSFVSDDHSFSPRFFAASIALWLLVWLGYNLQYLEPNHSIGVVTPWTTKSAKNWEETHTHAGYALIIVGFVLLICAFFVPVGIPLLLVTLLLWLGSYLYLVGFSWYKSGGDSLNESLLPK